MKGWEQLASNIESNMPSRIVEKLRDRETYTEKLPDRYVLYKKGKFPYPQPPDNRVPQMVIFMYRRWRTKRVKD